MTSTTFYRASGMSLLLGGLFMTVAVPDLPTPLAITALVLLLGGGLSLLGLPALYARQASQIGWVGMVGLVIIGLDILIFPIQQGINDLAPAFKLPEFLYIIGPLTIVGTLLFGVMTIRARVFPRWLGWTLFSGFIIAVVGNILLPENFVPFVGHPGEWIFWLTLSTLGYILLTEPSARGAHAVSGAAEKVASSVAD